MVAAQFEGDLIGPAATAPTITVVNDTRETWRAVACTGDYYPDKTQLAPAATWRPYAWPFQDDDGAGCYLASVDSAGHLGDGVCLSVPQNGKDVFRMSDARPTSLADCMARSNPSI